MTLAPGTRALATGGGSGLGKELCRELARRGARLWITDIDLASAESTARECAALGAREARAFGCDVRRKEDLERLATRAREEWQGLDFLVNNAGVALGGNFEEQSLENWQWIIEINLWGVIHGCHYFLPLMKQSGRGAILNIASAAGLFSPPHMSGYNVSKAAVISLSESLRTECLGSGIHVAVACPTFFESGIFDRARLARPELRDTVRKLVDRSPSTARGVARACLRAVEEKRFYVLPSWDAKLLWLGKRIAPAAFARVWSALIPGMTEPAP